MTNRLAKLREGLEKAGCDAFASMAPPTNQYLTGFTGTESALLVTSTEALFLCDFRYIENVREAAKSDSLMANFEVKEARGSLAERIGEYLSDLNVERAGLDETVTTIAELNAVKKAYSGHIEDASKLVQTLRAIKDPDEIEKIRSASALAENVLQDVISGVCEGITERELAARFEYEFKKQGASGASFDTIILFGARSSLPHGHPGDVALKQGDIVLMDFGCKMDGYCSDLTRTYVYGTIPGTWFEEIYDLTLTAQRLALELLAAGKSCREVDSAARSIIVDAGYGEHFGHGLGHGVGIEVHEFPRLNPESDTVLEDGMVLTVEPGIYIPGRGGVRIEELVHVTENGCEVLSTTPTELKVLGI